MAPEEFLLWCVNCQRHKDEHPSDKCLFSPTHFEPTVIGPGTLVPERLRVILLRHKERQREQDKLRKCKHKF